ncbi:hypothetical protein WJX73_000190 [Symbiochloris irregularis]|uniref:Serine-threonine kinase receptor-associated protein n=1 Tax=Symbiochloris irregularis TaxID=706552 RepID=A0AAW1NUX6_9CHLO
MPPQKPRPQPPLVCHGHERPIVELSYSPVTPDGYFLTSASKDGLPMLRNGSTGDWIGTFQGHKGAVWSCILNDSATVAATASADFSARVWDALSGKELHNFAHPHIVRTLQFMHHSNKLLTAGWPKLMRLYDLERPEAEPQIVEGVPDNVRCASLHPEDKVLLTSYIDKPGISVWDLRTAQIVSSMAAPSKVTSIEVQPDGSRFLTADGHEAKGRIAAGGEDLWVHLHDYDSGVEIECNKGHHGPVHCVRFAPGGESYASGSEDGTIRIWSTDWSLKDNPDPDGFPLPNGS